MKYTRVIPLHKSGSSKEPANYRQIALINIISKVFDKHLNQKMISFLENLKTFNDHQFGFRMNRSTIEALSIVIEEALEENNIVKGLIASSLDFREAFDAVSYSLKLDKLHSYGISDKCLHLLEIYLPTQ